MNELFSRIAVGVDGSEPSKYAVAYAARLARDHQGTLLLFHAVNWLPTVSEAASAGVLIDTNAIIEGLKEAGEMLLDEAVLEAKRFGVDAERHAREGEPATALLRFVNDAGCGLIVMGTHGRRGFGRLFLGSTTEAVLRRSTIPVLTLHSQTPAADEVRRCLGRVLVAIDDSEPSDAAVEVALGLPAQDRNELLFYSVVDIDIPVGIAYTAAVEAEKFADANGAVERAVASALAKNIVVRGYTVEGRPDDTIVAAAKEEAVDLIVLGSHGRRGLRRFFLGSVAEAVVRSATVPVLVVRSLIRIEARRSG